MVVTPEVRQKLTQDVPGSAGGGLGVLAGFWLDFHTFYTRFFFSNLGVNFGHFLLRFFTRDLTLLNFPLLVTFFLKFKKMHFFGGANILDGDGPYIIICHIKTFCVP